MMKSYSFYKQYRTNMNDSKYNKLFNTFEKYYCCFWSILQFLIENVLPQNERFVRIGFLEWIQLVIRRANIHFSF